MKKIIEYIITGICFGILGIMLMIFFIGGNI